MVGSSGGAKSSDVFGTLSCSPACGSTLQKSNPLNPPCPKCGSSKTWRNGYYTPLFGDRVQRLFCRECSFKFSDPDGLLKAKETFQRVEKIESNGIRSAPELPSTRQICVMETKNLTSELKTTTVPQGCELSLEQLQKLKGAIVEFMWDLQKNQNASEDTYMPYGENLKFLVKNNADLFNPESVKNVVTKLQKTDIRKYNLIKAYRSFMKYAGLQGQLPTYTYIRTMPFIPLETEIDQLIAGCGSYCKQMPIFLQLLKETGARMGEAYRLTWGDIDTIAKTISIRPEKGSNPRLNKISEKLLLLIFSLQKNPIPNPKEKVFSWKQKSYIGKSFRKMRSRVVANTGNQRLLKIHFHTLRYWRGTQVYIKTKSLAHVMVQLGHRSWSSAQLYVSLAEATAETSEEWITAVATTLDQALNLIKQGFEKHDEWENAKIYRKRKN